MSPRTALGRCRRALWSKNIPTVWVKALRISLSPPRSRPPGLAIVPAGKSTWTKRSGGTRSGGSGLKRPLASARRPLYQKAWSSEGLWFLRCSGKEPGPTRGRGLRRVAAWGRGAGVRRPWQSRRRAATLAASRRHRAWEEALSEGGRRPRAMAGQTGLRPVGCGWWQRCGGKAVV